MLNGLRTEKMNKLPSMPKFITARHSFKSATDKSSTDPESASFFISPRVSARYAGVRSSMRNSKSTLLAGDNLGRNNSKLKISHTPALGRESVASMAALPSTLKNLDLDHD